MPNKSETMFSKLKIAAETLKLQLYCCIDNQKIHSVAN